MKFLLPLVLSLGIVGCTTTGGVDYNTTLSAAFDAYKVYCATSKNTTNCSKAAAKKASDAYTAAEQAVTDFQSGAITQAELDAAIQSALKLWADFQK